MPPQGPKEAGKVLLVVALVNLRLEMREPERGLLSGRWRSRMEELCSQFASAELIFSGGHRRPTEQVGMFPGLTLEV